MAQIEVSAEIQATEPQLRKLETILGTFQRYEAIETKWKKAPDLMHDIPKSDVRVQGNFSIVYLGRVQRNEGACQAQAVCKAEVKEDPKLFLAALGYELALTTNVDCLCIKLDSNFTLSVSNKDQSFTCRVSGMFDELELGWTSLQQHIRRLKLYLELP
mmetsp:Transcript_13526/g.25466  ORF Transcript_13526/g.25466 Transcript_13526/m.25466 type:complete len:159 (+) Transcript_13526:651-1127(+)|eukprot:CAMPEP_0204903896 /NCGR_PEP_ID=MMETSP1397-20131031/4549_1 /ASSEMBLY_ACC=CAM_ASM_000891 /TAXON_ID=49980 /ORGANISM="Climacostomum Climacostomum virens, Strain Stock W-24" /LENGTH=158 /DNA_ID=CAMNT_0052072609 /DNA_START=599 /DNA_END=1075 /DNA_ORIENTATION=+